MIVSRDPDGIPKITPELAADARLLGMHIVHMVCDEPNAKVGDTGGISFLALVPSIPRAGERIQLEDKRRCEVKRVHWRAVSDRDKSGKVRAIVLVPNVIAIAISSEQ